MASEMTALHDLDQHGRRHILAPATSAVTVSMGKLSLHPSAQSAGLDCLPEELIEAILRNLSPSADQSIYNVQPLQDLSAVSMVSKKLRRIAEPLLYHSVPITIGRRGRELKVPIESFTADQSALGPTWYAEYSVPTEQNCTAKLFVRTLRDRPELSRHVKIVAMARDDYGCRRRIMLGYYGWMPGTEPLLSNQQLKRAELLEVIFSYLHPPPLTSIHSLDALQDLSSVSQVSKKFRRIAEPHLYSSVNIVINKVGLQIHAPIESWGRQHVEGLHATFNMPTLEGSNPEAFIRTITTRPELATFVQALSMRREEYGYHDRDKLEAYGWGMETESQQSRKAISHAEAVEAMRSGIPITVERMRSAKVILSPDRKDRALATAETVLGLLPHIEHLDCSRYITDVFWSGILESTSSRPVKWQGSFSVLTQLELCGAGRLSRLQPVFSLPKLKKLGLINACHKSRLSDDEVRRWSSLKSCGVEELQIDNLRLDWWHIGDSPDRNPLCLIAALTTRLRSLSITTNQMGDARMVIGAFKEACRVCIALASTALKGSRHSASRSALRCKIQTFGGRLGRPQTRSTYGSLDVDIPLECAYCGSYDITRCWCGEKTNKIEDGRHENCATSGEVIMRSEMIIYGGARLCDVCLRDS